MSPFDLTGKLAVVTGARRGIGRAMALGLAEAGADIIGVSANLEPGSEIEKEVTALGRSFEAIQADTSGAVVAIGEIAEIITSINDYQNTIASAVEEQTATTNASTHNVS